MLTSTTRKLTNEQLKILVNTKSDDLLKIFPDFKRKYLRKVRQEELSKNITLPKILLFDIETSPMLLWAWGLWEQTFNIGQIKQDWFILSWSAKWLYEPEVMYGRLTGKEARNQDDKRITKSLWKLIDEAQILLGHNIDRFDRPKMNTRFIKHGLKHPSPYQTIDTLKIARKEFKITSNKLNYLCKYLGLDTKLNTNFDLWKECMKGNEKALKEMDKYCRQDIIILEELYLKLRPYMHSHPNLGLYMNTDELVCPNCGSQELTWGSKYTTGSSQFKTARCECGAFVRNNVRTSKTPDKTLAR